MVSFAAAVKVFFLFKDPQAHSVLSSGDQLVILYRRCNIIQKEASD